MNYDYLEQAVLQLLAPLSGAADVVQQPEVQGQLQRSIVKPKVTVSYMESDFGKTRDTDLVAQDEEAFIRISIQAQKLRGADGLHHVVGIVKKLLLGKNPKLDSQVSGDPPLWWSNKLYLAKPTGYVDYIEGVHTFWVSFVTKVTNVEDTPQNTAPLISQITILSTPQ